MCDDLTGNWWPQRERELSWNIKSPPAPAALKDHNLSPMKGHSLFLWSERGGVGGMEQLFSYCDYYDLWLGEPSPVTVADTDQLITFSPGWGSLTGKLRITVPSYSPEPGTEQEKCCFPHNNHNYSASHSNRNECVGKNDTTEIYWWRREMFLETHHRSSN